MKKTRTAGNQGKRLLFLRECRDKNYTSLGPISPALGKPRHWPIGAWGCFCGIGRRPGLHSQMTSSPSAALVITRNHHSTPTTKYSAQSASVFERPFVKRFALRYWTDVLSVLSVTLVYCGPNGWMDQDESWHGDRPRPRPHC